MANQRQKLQRVLHRRRQKINNGKKLRDLGEPNYTSTQTAQSGHAGSRSK